MNQGFYLLTIFTSQFLYFLLSFSLLTYFSFNTKTVNETAMSVGLFSLGTLLALGIFRLTSKSLKRNVFLAALLIIGFLASSLMAFSLPQITLITGLGIVLISSSLSWTNSFLLAQSTFVGSISELSRKIQFYSTLAVLAGVSIGPILSTHVSYQKIWVIVSAGLAVLFIMTYFWMFRRLPLLLVKKDTSIVESFTRKKTKLEFLSYQVYPLVSLGIVWIATGFFQVYEVKILIDRFNLDSVYISGIFAATLLANLLTVKFISPAVRNQGLSMVVSAAVILVCCSFYLISFNLLFVTCIILLIGLFNGLFNVGYTNLILKISNQSDRERTFLLARVVSQVSLACSTVLATLITIDHVSIMISFLLIFGLSLAVFLKMKLNRLKACVSVLLFIFFSLATSRSFGGELTILNLTNC